MRAPNFIAEELLHPDAPEENESDVPSGKLNGPVHPASEPSDSDPPEDSPCWIVVSEGARFHTTGFLFLPSELDGNDAKNRLP